MNEATAYITITTLLEAAGWSFFSDGALPANVQLEPSVTLTTTALDALGNDVEKTTRGYVDVLLLDAKGFPLIVLEAKSQDKHPSVARKRCSSPTATTMASATPGTAPIRNRASGATPRSRRLCCPTVRVPARVKPS